MDGFSRVTLDERMLKTNRSEVRISLKKLPVWMLVGLKGFPRVELVLGYLGEIPSANQEPLLFNGARLEERELGTVVEHPRTTLYMVNAEDWGDGLELAERYGSVHLGPHSVSIPRSMSSIGGQGMARVRSKLSSVSLGDAGSFILRLSTGRAIPAIAEEPELMAATPEHRRPYFAANGLEYGAIGGYVELTGKSPSRQIQNLLTVLY